jgi:hypothetical protein
MNANGIIMEPATIATVLGVTTADLSAKKTIRGNNNVTWGSKRAANEIRNPETNISRSPFFENIV